ncbi:hypothetical protein ACFQH6_01690 [Halobacteriaceae archaeon GCM10025711]
MSSPGLTLTQQVPASAGPTVQLGTQPPSQIWSDLASDSAIQRTLVDAVRTLLANATHYERVHVLEEAGVTAADGAYARVLAGVDRPPEDDDHQAALELTQQFGSWENSLLGFPVSLTQLPNGPLAALDAADRAITISVRVESSFREQRADQRRRLAELLAELAQVFDVRVVATTYMQRWLATHHRAELPGSVSEQCTTQHTGSPVSAVVDEARDALDPDGRDVAILRSIASAASETQSYKQLYGMFPEVEDSRIRQVLGRLEDLGLVAKFGSRTDRHVELLQGGRALLDVLDEELGQQQRLDESVSATGNPVDDSRDIPHAREGPTAGDAGRPGWAEGPVQVAAMARWRQAAATHSAPAGGIGAVDRPEPGKDDPREAEWAFDQEADRLVVGAVATRSALQYWTSVARALTSPKTWRMVLTKDRLGDVDVPELLLRHARNLGGLPSGGFEAYDELVENIQDWRTYLEDLTRQYKHGEYDDRNRFRGEILRSAHGLAGTMVHLLDVAGVDVVRECRVPDLAEFSADQKDALVETLATGVAIQSRYGEFAAFRQLYEQREGLRDAAIAPRVDAADSLGEFIGRLTIVGQDGSRPVDRLQDRLREPRALHEDAPEFAVRVPVRTDQHRPTYAQVAREVLATKRLEPTREAVSVLQAFTGSPYDAAFALGRGLASETYSRELRVDELRVALSALAPERILPEMPPTVSKAIHALLTTEAVLSQRELADRAGVSTRSLREYTDILTAFDIVRAIDSGYRLALSTRDEAGVLPWYVGDSLVETRDVVFEAALDLADPDRVTDPGDPVGSTFYWPPDLEQLRRPWPWITPWLRVVHGLVDDVLQEASDGHVEFGAVRKQASLQAAVAGGGEA